MMFGRLVIRTRSSIGTAPSGLSSPASVPRDVMKIPWEIASSRLRRRALHWAIGAATLPTGCNSLFDIHEGRLEGRPGVGVGVVGVDCTPSSTRLAPADGLIADFMGESGGIEITGEMVTFSAPTINGPGSPTYAIDGGTLHIGENAPVTSGARYLGVILSFDGCVDASAFSGVQFSISASPLDGCTMAYATGDVAHQSKTSGLPYATGSTTAYPPAAPVAPEQTPATWMMPFVGGPTGGSPATPVDTTKLTFVMWEFVVAAGTVGGSTSCAADVSIDDMKFY